MDFSTYPRLTGRDPWPTTRAPDRVSGNQVTTTGKFLAHPWQSESENLPSDLFLQDESLNLGVNNFTNAGGTRVVQLDATQGGATNHFPSTSWGFKGNEAGGGSHDVVPHNNQYLGGLELAQQSGSQYMELEHSRAYDSSNQHMHWSL
ncbi:hypothetical protein Acr_01g0004180 [Actinidia rufa]|uniref:Uncharacterized protein n=1 Tax=Actinidia rufa TaxID=165716 RepID=A0A7J0E3W5_9ERIC|nr:hypothetical protein Acr_01g0004180 [Actinidia rufa]